MDDKEQEELLKLKEEFDKRLIIALGTPQESEDAENKIKVTQKNKYKKYRLKLS